MSGSVERYISSIAKHIYHYINSEADKYKLSMHQLYILRILYNNEGINQEELSDIYRSDKITISKQLDGLVEEGYVEKKKDEDDRRIKKLYVTEKGQKIRGEINNISKKTEEILCHDLSEKENIIIKKLLNRMLDNIYREINS